MVKISVEIPTDGKYCGDCPFYNYSVFLHRNYCTLFQPDNSLLGFELVSEDDANKPIRCQKCIDNELELAIENILTE